MIQKSKSLGQFFTPTPVAGSLVQWVVRKQTDRLLDPSCGDGQFLVHHPHSVGIEIDPDHARAARGRAPGSMIHGGDFFCWATETEERFEAVAGNPPFIRYQTFSGEARLRAQRAALSMGADFSGLSSSWAPFVIAAAKLLLRGGRMAFVVPAEIGHARYAEALLRALCNHFEKVQVVAYREKLFPKLSEDCWTLFCTGFGGMCTGFHLTAAESFAPSDSPPNPTVFVSIEQWESAGHRLRPFLIPAESLALYRELSSKPSVARLGELAKVNIGYVSGDNSFFHLRPSQARSLSLPDDCLRVAVRKSEQLPKSSVDKSVVDSWLRNDAPVLLLDLSKVSNVPQSVRRYLDSEEGQSARASYKCKNREPWYIVPDVKTPSAFLSVMCGERPVLSENEAGCACSNSILAVSLSEGTEVSTLKMGWNTKLAELGAELEGHPLGGGMLKLEPREAAAIPIPLNRMRLSKDQLGCLDRGISEAKRWRHHA